MSEISYDDFAKLELRIGLVKSVERVEGAEKLYKLSVDVGGEERQLVAGLAEFLSPEEINGKNIVVLTNLAPRKIRGVESQGMLLAAEAGGRVSLLTADGMPPGALIR